MIGSFNADVTLVSESERGNLKKKKQQESTGQVSNLNETRDCKGNSEGVMSFSTHTPKASYIQPAPSPIASKLQLYSQVYSRKRWSKRKSISGVQENFHSILPLGVYTFFQKLVMINEFFQRKVGSHLFSKACRFFS